MFKKLAPSVIGVATILVDQICNKCGWSELPQLWFLVTIVNIFTIYK